MQHFAQHWLFAEYRKDETICDDSLPIYREGVQQNPYNSMC